MGKTPNFCLIKKVKVMYAFMCELFVGYLINNSGIICQLLLLYFDVLCRKNINKRSAENVHLTSYRKDFFLLSPSF